MTLEPILNASPAIQIHVVTVVPAALLGAWLLTRRKGTPLHRILGRIWMALMVITALSTFFIQTIRMIGPFSPIHILSLSVLYGCFQAIRMARNGNIAAHKRIVVSVYVSGIGIAGVFTMLPGRIMHEVVFAGQSPGAMVTVITLIGCLAAVFLVPAKPRRAPSSWFSR